MKEHEVELINRLESIWRRKWFILVPTFLLAVLAGAVSFLLPPKWEVDTVILPGKFLVETQAGQFIEFWVSDPREIAGGINQKSYDTMIATELKIDIRKMPKLKAENLKDTKLVKVSLTDNDVKKAKAILNFLFVQLKRNLDTKIEVETNNIDTKISQKKFLIDFLTKDIAIIQKKLMILEKRGNEIDAEMKEAKERNRNIEKQQLGSLKKGEKSESETLGLLLYSNEIQKNLQYYNTLNELLSEKSLDRAKLDQDIKEKEQEIEKSKSEISSLEQSKARIDYTRMVKEPTSSLFPVTPKKKLNILITAILSLILFTMLALFLEFISPKGAAKT